MEEMPAEEAGNWKFRGEGAANIVLDYVGTNSRLVGKVLRLRKVVAASKGKAATTGPDPAGPIAGLEGESGASQAAGHKFVLPDLERRLWSSWPAVTDAMSTAELVHAYCSNFIVPLLGSDHVDPGVVVHVGEDFLRAVHHACEPFRSIKRRASGELALVPGKALIISDHSLFADALPDPTPNNSPPPPTICVEIKPKCGFLPKSPCVARVNDAKRRVSRYQMHQRLKLAEGKVHAVSRYNPLDLFSGSPEAMARAIAALADTPQNNLRVFRDGDEVTLLPDLGGPASGADARSADSATGAPTCNPEPAGDGKAAGGRGSKPGMGGGGGGSDGGEEGSGECGLLPPPRDCPDVGAPIHPSLEDALVGFVTGERGGVGEGKSGSGWRSAILWGRLLQCLVADDALPRVLRTQRLDVHDIEGVVVAYERFCGLRMGEGGVSERMVEGEGGMHGEERSCVVAGEEEAGGEGGGGDREQASAARDRIGGMGVEGWGNVLRDFLVSATAKDCGVMVTMQVLPAGAAGAETVEGGCEGERDVGCRRRWKVMQCGATGELYRYKISFVDLDMKPLKKIPKYFSLDQEIVQHYSKMSMQTQVMHASEP